MVNNLLNRGVFIDYESFYDIFIYIFGINQIILEISISFRKSIALLAALAAVKIALLSALRMRSQ